MPRRGSQHYGLIGARQERLLFDQDNEWNQRKLDGTKAGDKDQLGAGGATGRRSID